MARLPRKMRVCGAREPVIICGFTVVVAVVVVVVIGTGVKVLGDRGSTKETLTSEGVGIAQPIFGERYQSCGLVGGN